MKYEVNRFWVKSVFRLLKSKGLVCSDLDRIVNVNSSDGVRGLTEAQCSQFIYLANEKYPIERILSESVRYGKITDYYMIGLLLSSHVNSYELLYNTEFLRRYIMHGLEVKKTESTNSLSIQYTPPTGADFSICYIMLHFLMYAANRISENCGHFEVDRISYDGISYCSNNNWKDSIVKESYRKGHSIELHLRRVNNSLDVIEKSDIYEKLWAMMVRDDRYILSKSISDKVLWLAYQNIENPKFNHVWVAQELGMSERKLQKCLKDQGTSYRELLDQVRKDLSEKYLTEDHYSVTQTGLKLGYTATSNFIRAYKRWWGHSPLAKAS